MATLDARIDARRALHCMAFDLAIFHPRDRVGRLLVERAPDLVAALDDREVTAIIHVVNGPLGPR